MDRTIALMCSMLLSWLMYEHLPSASDMQVLMSSASPWEAGPELLGRSSVWSHDLHTGVGSA